MALRKYVMMNGMHLEKGVMYTFDPKKTTIVESDRPLDKDHPARFRRVTKVDLNPLTADDDDEVSLVTPPKKGKGEPEPRSVNEKDEADKKFAAKNAPGQAEPESVEEVSKYGEDVTADFDPEDVPKNVKVFLSEDKGHTIVKGNKVVGHDIKKPKEVVAALKEISKQKKSKDDSEE